jgi:hypothetical protein
MFSSQSGRLQTRGYEHALVSHQTDDPTESKASPAIRLLVTSWTIRDLTRWSDTVIALPVTAECIRTGGGTGRVEQAMNVDLVHCNCSACPRPCNIISAQWPRSYEVCWEHSLVRMPEPCSATGLYASSLPDASPSSSVKQPVSLDLDLRIGFSMPLGVRATAHPKGSAMRQGAASCIRHPQTIVIVVSSIKQHSRKFIANSWCALRLL